MVSIIKKMKNTEDGVAAVEFAIVLPILLLLLFGIIEFSVIFYNKAMITNASREGARAGIVYDWDEDSSGLTHQEIETVVMNYLGDNLINFGGESNAEVTTSGIGGSAGDPLEVNVTYRYDYLILPGFVESLAGGLNLSARTVMRIE